MHVDGHGQLDYQISTINLSRPVRRAPTPKLPIVLVSVLVVEMVPPRVVEMVPVRVVEMVPLLVVEIVPVRVVEIVPDFAITVDVTNDATITAPTIDFKFFITAPCIRK